MKGVPQDLAGKTFNTIRVIERCEDFEGSSDTRVQYKVRCDKCLCVYKVPARYIQRRKTYYACTRCPIVKSIMKLEMDKRYLDIRIEELKARI